MSLFKQFSKSLYSPKHIAAFRFQSIGKIIAYLFFLAVLMGIPAFWAAAVYLTGETSSAAEAMKESLPFLTAVQNQEENKGIFLAAGLFFYYVLLSFTLFLKATVFAGIGVLFVSLLKKRGEYRHLFRMAAYSLTLPLLITTAAELGGLTYSFDYLLDWLLTAIMLLFSIRFLPGIPR
ncbi:DUF1189 family protein [Domibacillus indicus]|uniref:DUF1189 family protein n=1 Tax=Domibacillus indicus TaxID=1437523 RepID=UPI000617C01E|nr:DUF1189 family protein [Domibacillus indicus]